MVVDGDKVLCMPGGPKGRVVALDKRTGKTLWANTEIEHSAAYCSPLVVTYRGVRQLITHDAEVGGRRGRRDRQAGLVGPLRAPLAAERADAGLPRRLRVRRLRPLLGRHGAEDRPRRTTRAATVWYRKDLDNCHGGAILVDGKLFGCGCRQGGKNFYCVDFLTGETQKLDKTLGKVGITCADGMLYCLNHQRHDVAAGDHARRVRRSSASSTWARGPPTPTSPIRWSAAAGSTSAATRTSSHTTSPPRSGNRSRVDVGWALLAGSSAMSISWIGRRGSPSSAASVRSHSAWRAFQGVAMPLLTPASLTTHIYYARNTGWWVSNSLFTNKSTLYGGAYT